MNNDVVCAYAHNCYHRCTAVFVWHQGNIGLGLNREACVAMHRSLRAQACLALAVSIHFIPYASMLTTLARADAMALAIRLGS